MISDDKRFLPDPYQRPVTHVERAILEEYRDHPTPSVRYYLRTRVVSWSGELIYTIFVRFFILGKKLFIEVEDFLLPPIKDEYRLIDKFWTVPVGIAEEARKKTIPTILSVFSRGYNITKQEKRDAFEAIKLRQTYDYGATISLREEAATLTYTQYFQRLDKEMFAKVIERQLLDSIFVFLDSKHIDTSDFKEQRQTILNNGVIVSGGSLTAENLIAGQGGSVVQNYESKAQPRQQRQPQSTQ